MTFFSPRIFVKHQRPSWELGIIQEQKTEEAFPAPMTRAVSRFTGEPAVRSARAAGCVLLCGGRGWWSPQAWLGGCLGSRDRHASPVSGVPSWA